MKKIVFFTENRWAFGSIHHALCKLLFAQGFNCEVLDFFTQYQQAEMRQIDQATDLFVTTPPGAVWLLGYGVDPQKIRAVAHGQWDILLAKNRMGLDFDQLGGYAVVSNILKAKSQEFGISRQPQITPVGIFFDRFYHKVSDQLNAIGYAAAWESNNFWGQEIKRGRLVGAIADRAGVPLTVCNQYHYLAMPRFYPQVDCVIMSSVEEGAGLPMMEAAAAGRLTLGTPVGYFEENTRPGALAGIRLPLPEQAFVTAGADIVEFYREQPENYRRKCLEIQAYARDRYDWSNFLIQWVDFLS